MWVTIAVILGLLGVVLVATSLISRFLMFLFITALLILIAVGMLTMGEPIRAIKTGFSQFTSQDRLQSYLELTSVVKGHVDDFIFSDGKVSFHSSGLNGEVSFKNTETLQMTIHSDLSPLANETVKKLAITFSKDATLIERLTGVLQNPIDSQVHLDSGWLQIKDNELTLTLEKQVGGHGGTL